MRGVLFIITGLPSTGTGKTSVIEAALRCFASIERIITNTSRPPRPGEVDGRDYRFRSVEEFARMRAEGHVAECDKHHEHWYWTLRSDIAKALACSHAAVIITDPRGAATLAREYPDARLVAITAPLRSVRARMKRRGDADEKIAARLAALPEEKAVFKKLSFDLVIKNKDGRMIQCVTELTTFVNNVLSNSV